jgi:predicted HTH domain antitoxin
MSQVLQVEMPDDVVLALQKDRQHLAQEMRLAAAAKWYEMGLLSQGQAAQAAGLSRAAFLNELGRFGVSPFQETVEEALQTVQELCG